MRTHVRLLNKEMSGRGYQLFFACPAGYSLFEDDDIYGSSKKMIQAPIVPHPHPFYDFKAAVQIACSAREIDMLHGHGLRGAWIAFLASRLSRKPFLFTAHNLAPAHVGGIEQALLKRTIKASSSVIVISHAVAQSLSRYGLEEGQSVLIPNGVDVSEIDKSLQRPWNWQDFGIEFPLGGSIVAAAGRLSPEKGFETLLHAASLVRSSFAETNFLLAGEGAERARLASLIPGYGLTGNFLLTGQIKNVPAFFSLADIIVIPSYAEGQGLAALEAMAVKRCVVASDVGGLSETVEDGITGFLIPPQDAESMARVILQLLENEELRDRMGKAGRGLVETRYTLKLMGESLDRLYSSLLWKSETQISQ
jgi:glycosyltransferase involved in cell wall biosynthesis